MTNSPISPQEAANELLSRRKARRDLLDFTLYTKPDYQVNWHHRVLCRYLTRFAAGEIKRLMVFMPPRHGKSELVSRRLPAYIFGNAPDSEIIATSYSADLASRMNRDVQRIMDSPEYGRVFPDAKLWGKNVRNGADGSYLRNSEIFEIVGHRGSYRSAGVGGGITGMGMHFGIIDDPLRNRQDANSPTKRRTQYDWFWSAFYTRLAPNGSILLNLTRWHTHDIAGELMRAMEENEHADEWVILDFPALAKMQRHPDDPREPGEALWAERYPVEYLERLKAQNAFEFEALYQQSPLSAGGGMFNTNMLKIIKPHELPEFKRVVRFYDLAVTAKSSADFTAGVKLGVTLDEQYIVLDVWRAQKELPDVHKVIVQNAAADGRGVAIRLEAEKAGIVQLQYLLRDPEMSPYTISAKPPVGDKFTRANAPATRVNNGRVALLQGHWNRAFIDELAFFGAAAEHDDQVDAFSGAYDMLTASGDFILFGD